MRRSVSVIALMSACLLSASSSKAQSQTDYSYWPMESIEGQTILDQSSRKVDGLVIGDPVIVPGKVGNALLLDGSDDYIRFSDPGSDWALDLSTPFTISVWINPSNGTGTRQIISKDNVFEFEIGRSGANRYGIRLNNGGQGLGLTPVVLDQWQHLAVTWNGSTVSYYYNGDADGSDPFSGPLASNNTAVGIGSRPGNYFFEGAVDEVLLIEAALSATEIDSIYSAGAGSPPNNPPTADAGSDQSITAPDASGALVHLDGSASSDPDGDALSYSWVANSTNLSGAMPSVFLPVGVYSIELTVSDGRGGQSTDLTEVAVAAPPIVQMPDAHWPFDDIIGNNTPEISGNGLDGKLVGGPSLTTGVVESAFQFDGSDDVVVVDDPGNNSPLDPVDNLTLAAWVKPLSSGATHGLMSKLSSFEFELGRSGSNNVTLQLNGKLVAGSNTPLETGIWQHVAATWDGTTVTYYIDGVADGTANYSGSLKQNNRDLKIGGSGRRTRYLLDGDLDDVRLYKTVLTSPEIAALAYIPPVNTDPVANAGPDQTLSIVSGTSIEVILDGSQSMDPDGDPLTYSWTDGITVLTGPTPSINLEAGSYTFSLTVDDGKGGSDTDDVLITVEPPDPSAFHPTHLDNMVFFVESIHGITPVTCNTTECWNNMQLYCDTDRFPDGCVRRWEDQSGYVPTPPRTFDPPQWTAGRDFGQDDHEKPELVLDCINGLPCVRGAEDMDTSFVDQSHSFEIEIGDLYGPISDGLSVYLLAKPVQQYEDYYFFGTSTSWLRHVVVDNRLVLKMGPGSDTFVTAPGAIEVGKWQLIEIHRNDAGLVQIIINGEDRTLGAPVFDDTFDFRFLFTKSRGEAMFGEYAGALIYGDALTEAEKLQVRTYFQNVYDIDNQPVDPPIDPVGPLVKYYIDADSGSDLNDGSIAAPFATVQHCVNQWGARNVIGRHISCRGRGIFNEQVLLTGSGPDSLRRNQLIPWDTDGDGDLSDETFVIDGANVNNVGIDATSGQPRNIEIGWLTIRNLRPVDGYKCDGLEVPEPSDQRLNFINIGGQQSAPSSHWWIHDNHFENLGVNCLIDGSYIAIRPTNTPNLLVENNYFSNTTGFLFRYFGGDDVIIRNNVFDNMDTGLKAWSTGLPVNRLHVLDNEFICRGFGFGVTFSDDVQDGVIARNTFRNCGNAIALGTDRDFGKVDNANHLIEDNLIYVEAEVMAGSGTGININDCSGPSVVTGQEIEVRDLLIRNNVIWRTGTSTKAYAGLFLRSGHLHSFVNNFKIYNNTIHGAEDGIRVDYCPDVKDSGGTYQPAVANLNGVDIRNNIFSDQRDHQFAFNQWQEIPTNVTTDYNMYSGNERWKYPYDGGTYDYLSFEAFKSLKGSDASSSFCEPDYVDLDDFHLTGSGTCAVGTGVTLADVPRDIDGDDRTLASAYDVGVDQSVTSIEKHTNVESPDDPPAVFQLLQNYPNPFNPSTVISFDLPKTGQVKLEVFDSIGKRVAILVDREMPRGSHEVTFDASKLATGSYYYRIHAGERSAVMRMVVLR